MQTFWDGELLLRAWVHEMAPKKVPVSCELSAEGEVTAVGQVLGVRLSI